MAGRSAAQGTNWTETHFVLVISLHFIICAQSYFRLLYLYGGNAL